MKTRLVYYVEQYPTRLHSTALRAKRFARDSMKSGILNGEVLVVAKAIDGPSHKVHVSTLSSPVGKWQDNPYLDDALKLITGEYSRVVYP